MWTSTDNIKVRRLLASNLPMRVVQNSNMILVDTGRLKAQKSMMEKLNKIAQTEDFKLIVLTHTHGDHIESLEKITKVWDVNVVVHRSESRNIAGLVDEKRIIEFEDSFDLNTYGINGKVVHTPGHSSGSSSIILNNEIALVGDLIGDFFTKPWAKNNRKVNISSVRSMESLLTLNCKCYIPAHKRNWFDYDQLNIVFQQYTSGEAIYEKQVNCK